jgi:ABC-2 type transport system permease protein
MVLFVMPTAFIIIMSLALQNTYSNKIDVKFNVLITGNEKSTPLKTLLSHFENSTFFNVSFSNTPHSNKEHLYNKSIDFVLHIPSGYLKKIQQNKDIHIYLYSKPNAPIQTINLLKQQLAANISKQLIKTLLVQLDVNTLNTKDFTNNIIHEFISKEHNIHINSVQQSVPSWLIFSMFFILIPISNTFINEKNFGTLRRMQSIDVPLILVLLGKIIPYYVINLIQVIFMIAVGIYIMPLLGASALSIQGNYFAVFSIASLVSLSAISFALVIANIAKKSEDATTIGGISNIIFAALGGIMVPKFIMPEKMQLISEFSPMSWALESFMQIMIQGGNLNDTYGYMLKLTLFAIICLIISYTLLKKQGTQ